VRIKNAPERGRAALLRADAEKVRQHPSGR
jgi:hypothetical protein